jgi:hypothetical protein
VPAIVGAFPKHMTSGGDGGGELIVEAAPPSVLPVGVALVAGDGSHAVIATISSARRHAARAIMRGRGTDEIPSDGGGEAA